MLVESPFIAHNDEVKAITDLQYASAHVNFFNQHRDWARFIRCKTKKLLELVIVSRGAGSMSW